MTSVKKCRMSPLTFMLSGIGMLLPVMMIYNGYQYLVFRGKVDDSGYGRE